MDPSTYDPRYTPGTDLGHINAFFHDLQHVNVGNNVDHFGQILRHRHADALLDVRFSMRSREMT